METVEFISEGNLKKLNILFPIRKDILGTFLFIQLIDFYNWKQFN